MLNSEFLLEYTLRYDFKTVLDIGPGVDNIATNFWLDHNKEVFSNDIEDFRNIKHEHHHFIQGSFLNIEEEKKFDLIWASHVLEHIQNTGLFLSKAKTLLNDNGVFFVIVPPFKHNIVGGHVHVWNMGLLMYNLILSGFNVREGRFIKKDYNIAGIVKKETRELPPLRYDNGDIEILKDFFPEDFFQGVYGDINQYNWFED